MIGFYDYTVILTYVGALLALLGMQQAIGGHFVAALLCLGGSLFCDTMDGKVARAKKNRTDKEKLFGIQIDSLCDLVSFGVFPCVLCYMAGLRDTLGCVLMGYYFLCCVIRLAFFNVVETFRAPGEKSTYHGLPVVGLAVLMPAVFMLRLWIPEEALLWVMRILFPLIGTLYIKDFKMNKPGIAQLAILSFVFWIPFAVVCVLG